MNGTWSSTGGVANAPQLIDAIVLAIEINETKINADEQKRKVDETGKVYEEACTKAAYNIVNQEAKELAKRKLDALKREYEASCEAGAVAITEKIADQHEAAFRAEEAGMLKNNNQPVVIQTDYAAFIRQNFQNPEAHAQLERYMQIRGLVRVLRVREFVRTRYPPQPEKKHGFGI